MAKREREVRMMLSDEEYTHIKARADKLHMTVSAYIRSMVLNGQIVVKNYHPIDRHTKEIAEVRNSLNRLVFTIEATNNYLPREIQTIVNLMEEIFKGENELLKTIREDGCIENIIDY